MKVYRTHSLVTCNPHHDVFEDAFLAVEGKRIVDVGPWKKRPKASRAKVEDLGFSLVMPGLFNLHTHLAMTLLRGVAEDLSLERWLFEVIFPLEKKYVSAPFVKLGTQLGAIECLKSGMTYLADMYFFEREVGKVFENLGIRGLLGTNISDLDGPDGKTAEGKAEIARRLHREFRDHELVQVSIAPHAPYTCSLKTLQLAASLAKELEVPLMIHMSETETELKNAKEKFGCPPFRQIEKAGILELPHVLAAHSVWVEEEELPLLKRPNMTAVLNPVCNAKLGSGFPPVDAYLKEGIRFTIGTDGPASNNRLDLFSELNMISKLHHLLTQDLAGLPGPSLIDAVTIRGAEAVGRQHELGSLEPGKFADFIVIDLKQPHLLPFHDPYAHLIHSVMGADVRHVLVNGKMRLKNRKVIGLDEEKVYREAERFRKKMKASRRSS